MEKTNILGVAKGAVMERLDYELAKVIDNINDMNTKPETARKLTLTLTFKPDSERQSINFATQVKSTLAPTKDIESSLTLMELDDKPVLVENVPQIPGQAFIDGTEQESPKVIDIKKAI